MKLSFRLFRVHCRLGLREDKIIREFAFLVERADYVEYAHDWCGEPVGKCCPGFTAMHWKIG